MSSGNRDKYVNDSTLCLRILVFKRVYNRFRLFLTSPKVTGPGELSDQNRMSAWSRFHFCKIHQNPWSSTQVKPKKWTILNDILPWFLPTSPTSLAFRWIQSIIVLSVAIWRHIPSRWNGHAGGIFITGGFSLPLWKIMDFVSWVSWDYDIPWMENHNPVMFQSPPTGSKLFSGGIFRSGPSRPGESDPWYIFPADALLGRSWKIWMSWKVAVSNMAPGENPVTR